MMSTPIQEEVAEINRRQIRVEDERFLRGKAHFLDDVNAEDQAYMGLALSPYAHARIKRIDLSKVRSSPDFIAALTGEDLIKEGVRPVTQNPWPPQRRAERYHLAVGKVRFVGEPVVAILARERYAVEDLLERVEIEYEPLPVVLDIEDSKAKKALVYDDWTDNTSQSDEEKEGDVEEAISSAPYVVRRRLGIRRQAAAPIEPHGALVSYDKTRDVYDVRATVQSVHSLRNTLSLELGVPKERFHVRVFDVGGGFGSKGGPSYPWPLIGCLFARRTGLPVKWTATRTEEFLEGAAGRDEYCDVTLACDRDGRIVALKGTIDCDVGVSGTQTHMPSATMWTMPGAYKIPNISLTVNAYVTNKMPIGPVRGAGVPEGCYFIERTIEIMAKRIGLDPLEFRRRNLVGPDEAGGEDYQAVVNTLVRSPYYRSLLEWKRSLSSDLDLERSDGSKTLAGVGFSLRGGSEEEDDDDEEEDGGAEWKTPARDDGRREPVRSDEARWREGAGLSFVAETAKVSIRADGTVTVYTGSSPHGQGHETAFAQLVAEELRVPISSVRVVWGDTDLVPSGIGTFGSRSAATGGSAVVDASRKLKSQILERAARALRKEPESMRMLGEKIVSASDTDKILSTLGTVLSATGENEISAFSVFSLKSMSYSSGLHMCAVELDVETGKATIAKYIVVEDCGRMINETIVDGQLRGGVVHGLGGSLFEGLTYDELGNLLTTNFTDYTIPTAADSPVIDIIHRTTPSKVTLNGVKGVGESGTIGSYAAVMNALNDALSQTDARNEVNIAPARTDRVHAATRAPFNGA